MPLNLSSKTWITIDGRIDHCPLYNLPIFEAIKVRGSTYDIIRRECLKRLAAITGRNIIIYYSGWLQKTGIQGLQVN